MIYCTKIVFLGQQLKICQVINATRKGEKNASNATRERSRFGRKINIGTKKMEFEERKMKSKIERVRLKK